uniref:Uncharacterized protein n=1 Tax=Mola mola TaxID=94237 RepID=A0A3Q3WSP1_MOLML
MDQSSGSFISFPGRGSSSSGPGTICGLVWHTLNPMVTGMLVIVVILGWYGSLACFRNITRLIKVNDSTILGATEDYADYHYLKQIIKHIVIEEDKLGMAYEPPTVATGFGAYLARLLMREEARDLVECYLKLLYYRDTCSYNRYEITIVTEEGMGIIGPLSSETNWDTSHIVSGLK